MSQSAEIIHADRLLTPGEVARIYHVTTETLARWRLEGNGPRFLKLGDRRTASGLATAASTSWSTSASP